MNNTDKPKRGRPAKPKQAETQEQAVEQATKRRNRPDLANFGAENVEPGDNTRYLRYAMVSMDLPPIDISDEKQVAQRISDYFEFCSNNDRKPNMIGMSNWLGVNRDTVKTWMTGEYRGSTHSVVIKKAVNILEELWVDYMQNGKVNPASGIFLGKNMFGYRDVQDIVVTPNNPLGDMPDQKALEERARQCSQEFELISHEANVPLDYDCRTEIEGIVDDIVDSIKEAQNGLD